MRISRSYRIARYRLEEGEWTTYPKTHRPLCRARLGSYSVIENIAFPFMRNAIPAKQVFLGTLRQQFHEKILVIQNEIQRGGWIRIHTCILTNTAFDIGFTSTNERASIAFEISNALEISDCCFSRSVPSNHPEIWMLCDKIILPNLNRFYDCNRFPDGLNSFGF